MGVAEESIEIGVSVEAAYRQFRQFDEYPRLVDGVQEVTPIDERHHHWTVGLAGSAREFDTEIVEEVPDQLIAWQTVSGEGAYRGEIRLRPLDGETSKVEVSLTVDPAGLVEEAAVALGVFEHGIQGVLQQFKEALEHAKREG